MKVLYLIRSGADDTVSALIEQHKKFSEVEIVGLAAGGIDYRILVERIFNADRVISW